MNANTGTKSKQMPWQTFCDGIDHEIGNVADEDFDFESFRTYYDQGMTPGEAVRQERLDAGI
jgi:hypothetical protein